MFWFSELVTIAFFLWILIYPRPLDIVIGVIIVSRSPSLIGFMHLFDSSFWDYSSQNIEKDQIICLLERWLCYNSLDQLKWSFENKFAYCMTKINIYFFSSLDNVNNQVLYCVSKTYFS